MIKRQCRNGRDRLDTVVYVTQPGLCLRNVIHQVAMTQHRALRDTRGPARVLQKCNVSEPKVNELQTDP